MSYWPTAYIHCDIGSDCNFILLANLWVISEIVPSVHKDSDPVVVDVDSGCRRSQPCTAGDSASTADPTHSGLDPVVSHRSFPPGELVCMAGHHGGELIKLLSTSIWMSCKLSSINHSCLQTFDEIPHLGRQCFILILLCKEFVMCLQLCLRSCSRWCTWVYTVC